MRAALFALKNLARYKRRTLITALALAFGVMAYIFVDSLLGGANADTERNFRLYETGGAIIVHSDYWEEHDLLGLAHTVDQAQALTEQFTAQGIPTTARLRTKGEAIVYYDPFPEDGSLQVQLYGVDLATQERVFNYHNVIADGEWLTTEGRTDVVIGGWLADDLGAEVGFPITIATQTKKGFRQTIDATIVGIMHCPNPLINRSAIFFPLSTLDTFLQLEGSRTELVFPQLNAEQDAYVQQVARADSMLAHIPFEILAEEFFALTKSEASGSGIMLFIIFIIAAVGVSNTMLMAVLERSREIGMLRAVGMSRGQIYRMFIYEAVGIGIIGGLAGVVLGGAANIPLVRYGIDYGALLRDFDFGYRIVSVFRGTWRPATFVGALFVAVIVSALTAHFPVRRILKRHSITDNLRAH